MIDHIMVTVLLIFLVATAVAVIRLTNLFAAVMLFGVYSLVSSSLFLVMDAADVAFTEAAVGAGISTVLMLVTLASTGSWEKETRRLRRSPFPFVLVLSMGLVLCWGTSDLPAFGDPDAPAHQHAAPRYIETSPKEIGIPNMVTSVLASYRGFDTLGEVTVIFAAGLGALLLLGRAPKGGGRL